MVRRFTVIQGGLTAEPAAGLRDSAVHHAAFCAGGQARSWQPAAASVVAGGESAAAASVDRALRVRLAALRRPIRLVGSVEPVRATAPLRHRSAANGSTRRHAIPAESFLGIRPRGWEPSASEAPRAAEPKPGRDALPTVPTRDGCTTVRPLMPAPSHWFRAHAVREALGSGGPSCLAVLRRAGAIVATSLWLGTAGASLPGRRALFRTVNPPRASEPVGTRAQP